MSREWHYGRMVTDLHPFCEGESVVVGLSTLKFSAPEMGDGYWIMSTEDDKKILLVADGHREMGKGLKWIVQRGARVEPSKQERCTEHAKVLMRNSAYAPANRKKMTYFFGGRPSKSKSMEWKYHG